MNDGGKIMSYLVSCLLVSSWHMSLVVVVAGGSGGFCWARGSCCGRCRGNDRYSQVSVVPEERRSAEFGCHSLCCRVLMQVWSLNSFLSTFQNQGSV